MDSTLTQLYAPKIMLIAISLGPFAFVYYKVLELISTFRFDYEYDLLTFELVMLTAKSSVILVANRKATRFDPKTILRIPVRQKFGRAKKLYS